MINKKFDKQEINKPIIGLIPLVDKEKDSLWMLPDYMNAIIECGGVPIILPMTDDDEIIEKMSDTINGLLVTGGQDVNPELYFEEIKPYCGELCKERDILEVKFLDRMIKKDKPVFGICRGLQIMNVFFGGTLYQDLKTEFPSNINHRMDPPNNRYEHKVRIVENTLFYDLFGEELDVNSCHHQGIKKLGPSLKECAISDEGLIEAFYRPLSKYVVAVQWHPERLYSFDQKQKLLFKKFVDKSKI